MSKFTSLKVRTMIAERAFLKTLAAAAAMALSLAAAPSFAQKVFATPEAASQAFVDAIAHSDADALRTVLGPDWRQFVPEGNFLDQEDIYDFLGAWATRHSTVRETPERAVLAAGPGDWTLPIPIVKSPAGWHFDPRSGADLMRTRRIGRNELAAMQAAMAYFDAQKEYAQSDRDNNPVLTYAQKFVSSPGKHDGLYWPDAPGQPESPLGPLYVGGRAGEGYHGYHFKILTAQGKDAPGGAYDYVVGGRMRSGFALIAWPTHWGETGVMSFMVSHDGQLYEKNLGPNTEALAREATRFDPDPSWRPVSLPGS
jgi:Protein of unknown function (DUF2950)